MTTYISLAISDTMFPQHSERLIRTRLSAEMVKRRLDMVEVISALNVSHSATIDAIARRFGLALPLPAHDAPAPKITLLPGDELFVVQAQFRRRLAEGERYSDEEIEAAPIAFSRWRVPMSVQMRAPAGIAQRIFEEIIDDAYAIALWQRGEEQLKALSQLHEDFGAECQELNEAAMHYHSCEQISEEKAVAYIDLTLEAADVLYKSLCIWHVSKCQENSLPRALYLFERHAVSSPREIVDAMLAKYARRAAGFPKDVEAERRLIAPLFANTAHLSPGEERAV
jgi:hypothetical protein